MALVDEVEVVFVVLDKVCVVLDKGFVVLDKVWVLLDKGFVVLDPIGTDLLVLVLLVVLPVLADIAEDGVRVGIEPVASQSRVGLRQ